MPDYEEIIRIAQQRHQEQEAAWLTEAGEKRFFVLYAGPVSGLTDEKLRKAWYKARLIQDGENQPAGRGQS